MSTQTPQEPQTVTCPTCGGSGEGETTTGTEWQCCGRYITNSHGEPIDCCNQPDPVPYPVRNPCSTCSGYGELPETELARAE